MQIISHALSYNIPLTWVTLKGKFFSSLEFKTNQHFQQQTTLHNNQIPIFGIHTNEITKLWDECRCRYLSDNNPGFLHTSAFNKSKKQQALARKEVTLNCLIGAIAADISLPNSKIIEICPGIGIPSITSALLKPQNQHYAVDINKKYLKMGQQAADIVNANINFIEANAEYYIPQHATKNDTLILHYNQRGIRKIGENMVFDNHMQGGVFCDYSYTDIDIAMLQFRCLMQGYKFNLISPQKDAKIGIIQRRK